MVSRRQDCVIEKYNGSVLLDKKNKEEVLWHPSALVLLLSGTEGVKIDLLAVHMDTLIYVFFSILLRVHTACVLSPACVLYLYTFFIVLVIGYDVTRAFS